MGGCLSKPALSDAQHFEAAKSPHVASEVPSTGHDGAKQGSEQQQVHLPDVPASSLSASGLLPPVLEAWSASDVLTWAAGLGLGPAAAGALQGCTGAQLLQLTDKGLLQLGVQDAAERQALLAARRSLQQGQQQQQPPAQQQQQQQAQSVTGQDAGAKQLASTSTGTSAVPLAGTGTQEAAGAAASANGVSSGAQDAAGGDRDATAPGVRFAPGSSLTDQGSGGQGSGDFVSQLVDQGETQDIQVLRITAAGRFFRHNRPVPVPLVPLCQAVCMLHDVRRGAHYHQENCHHLLQRLILVQDYLLALPLTELQGHTVLLAKLSVLVQDVYDVFNQFSDRGWLLRLLGPVRDQDDFNRLDQQLVNALQQAGVDTSEPPLLELSAYRAYQPQQQQLENVLKQLGITRLLRDPLSAMLRLQTLLNHLPSGSNIEVLLQQEIDYYLSSCMQFVDTNGAGSEASSRENSFSWVGGGDSLQKGNGLGGSNGSNASLRRSSSSGPLIASRARAAAMSAVEPYMVLRNDTVRAEWRSVFGNRERITWKEFWHKLVQPQAHIWGLDRQLDKFTTDYLQQRLQRGSHGLLTLAEMDFAFPPNVSPAMIVQARIKGHAAVSSAGMSPVNFGSRSAASKDSKLPGGISWLREVRVLQDPNPRLHNFPEFPSSYISRDEEVSELVLSMADVSTNLVMLTGAQGVGRSMLAASLAHELVNSQHWTDAYWIDMQGISNVVLAGQQLMAGLGLISDVSDTQQLLVWLEGRPRERFGIVLTHVQDLVMAPAEEHQGFLDLLDNILHSSHKLQVVVVCEEALPRITYSARTVDVGPLSETLAADMVRESQPGVSEEHCRFIVDVCSGAPVALAIVCNMLRYGHCTASEFVRLYSDPRLPLDRSLSNTNTNFLPFESRATNERLQRVIVTAMVNLPDVLVGALFVLSLLPSPFTLELMGPLLALAQTKPGKHAVLRRLVNLGLLNYNASLQQYSMHKVVREAARLLAHNLDLPFNETRHNYTERVVNSARRIVLPLMKKNRMLSARLAWSQLAVHVVQLINWAFQEVKPELLPLYVSLAWDLTPLLSSSCSSHTLQGFCQVVLERSQFLDANLESAKIMTVLASLLAESGALKRADTLLRQALELFWRELKDPTPAVARCYRELGALMLKAGKASEAAKHLQQALDLKEKLLGNTSPDLLTVLQLQVELLRRSRKYAEAERVCTRALGICGAAYGPSDVQVAFWKNQLAQVLRQAGRPSEAQSLSEEALSLLQNQLGSEHPRVAAQLMILGQLAAQQNKQAVAEQTFRKALQVYQSVSGLHHPDTFNCLTSLVALLRGAGKASQALPLAQRCLAVKKKSLGELHPDTAASMQVVADVMLDLGRYAEVEANCSRAVWVYRQINQPANSRPVITATTMQALALVLLGRASEAEQLATSCLEAAKGLPGPVGERNSFVASCFNCLGEVYREMGQLAESEAAAREGLALRQKDMGPEHPVVASALQTLGHVLRLRQQLEEALEVAKRCEALRSASSSQAQGPQMAAALHLQALIYTDMGDLALAYEKAQAALSMRQKVLAGDHPDLAHSLTAVADIFLMQNKYMDAEPLLSHAVQIFIAQLGSSHPVTQRAHALLKQANNPHTASSNMSMAMRLASDSTDFGSSRLASRDLDHLASLPQQPSASGAAFGGAAAGAAAFGGMAAAASMSGSSGPAGSAAAEGQQAAGDASGVDLGAAMAGSGVEEQPAQGSLTGSSKQQQQQQQAADAESTGLAGRQSSSTAGSNLTVSTDSGTGAAQRGGSGVGEDNAGFWYLETKADRSTDASTAAAAAAAATGATAAAPAAASTAAHSTSEGGASGSLPAPLEQPAVPPQRIPSTGSDGGEAAAAAAAAAATQAHPDQWELGRQLGQPGGLTGAADPDSGAYNMVLAELTRRASNAGAPEDARQVALHEEGLSKAAAAVKAQEAAQQAAAAAAAAGGAGSQQAADVPQAMAPSGAAAASVVAAAAATAAAAAGPSGAGTTLGELDEVESPTAQAAAASTTAAAAAAARGGEALGSAGVQEAPGSGDGEEGAHEAQAGSGDGEVFEQKMAQLEGLANIHSLTAFLREHGWQLSRLSDERDAGIPTRAQPAVTESSDPIPAATALTAAAASAGGAGAGEGAGEADFADVSKSAPLPVAGLALKLGGGAAVGGAAHQGQGHVTWGPFADAAQQQQSAAAPQQRPQQYRRRPSRHHSFADRSTVQLDPTWSLGRPRTPRGMRRGGLGMDGPGGYGGGLFDEGQLAYQQHQQQQQRLPLRSRIDPRAWDTNWPEHLDPADEDEYAELMYYQQRMAETQQQQQHAQEQGSWAAHHSRSRSFASQAAAGSRTMTAADIAQVIEAMHQRYQPQQHYEDAEPPFGLPGGPLGMHHSQSMHVPQHARQQLAPAWSSGLVPAGAGGYPRGPAAAAASAPVGRGRTRRMSFDSGAYAAAQLAHSSIWAPAAAAAAAECGYPLQMQASSELEQLQLQQQHMSSLYAAAAQHPMDAPGMHQQQQQPFAQEYGSGGSNRGSGASGSMSYSHQQQGLGSAAAAAAAAAVLQGQRSGASQHASLQPGSSGEGQPGGTPSGSRAAAAVNPIPGLLPKYPSNLSSYSNISATSARSGGLAAGVEMQGGGMHQQQQQQQQGEDAGGAAAASPPGAAQQSAFSKSSRLGTVSPEMPGRDARQQDLQMQQQQHNLVAARARSALHITRQGSGHSQSDLSPRSILSPHQQQQPGSVGQTPGSSAPVSSRSGQGIRADRSFNQGPGPQQQQHYSGSMAEHAGRLQQQQQQQQQQYMDVESHSPRYGAAPGAFRGPQQMPGQQRQQLPGLPRTPLLQQQQQQLYGDEDEPHYGGLSSAQQQYYDALAAAAAELDAGQGHWQQRPDLTHPNLAAALAMGAGPYAHHGPPPPTAASYQYGPGGPASTGSAQGRLGGGSNYQRLASLLAAKGYNPQAAAAALGGPREQQLLLSLLQYEQAAAAAAADAAAWEGDMSGGPVGEEEDPMAAASRVVMLQQQVASVQAARAELQNQQQEIEAYLAFTQMSGPEQQQALDYLAAQQYHDVQQQQQQQQQQHSQMQMQRPVSPMMGQLNVLGSSSSNVQHRQPSRGPSYMQQMGQPHSMMPPDAAAAAAGAAPGGYLHRGASTGSTASLGSPKSTHSARARAAAAMAAAVAAAGGRALTLEQAAAEAAAADGAGAQVPAVDAAGSSAPSPSNSQAPGSPSGSRSTPSRSGLSRGTSGNYEFAVPPAGMAPGSSGSTTPGAAAAAAAAAGRGLGPAPGSNKVAALVGQRSISPDRARRPASAAAVLGPQQQQKPLHRLHRDNSYDQQVQEGADVPPAMQTPQRAGSGNLGPQQQQRSPTGAALRGVQAPGMPPMPAAAWQQQQVLLPQHYVQLLLAQQQQQQQAQQQQQLQLPPQALPRRPARMSSPALYANPAVPTSPLGLQGGTNAGSGSSSYLPHSASAVAAALAAQQQQQLLQQQQQAQASRQALQGGPPNLRAGLPGSMSAGRTAAAAAGFRGGSASSVGMGPGGRMAAPFSAGMPASRPPASYQMGLQGVGYPGVAVPGYPQMPAVTSFGVPVGSQSSPASQQMAALLLRQQQQQQQQWRQQQQMAAGGPAAAAALAAAATAGGSRGSFGGGSEHGQAQQLGPQGSEDYGMWATPPDYGPTVHADEASSRGTSGNSRNILSPVGGQYWQGRRSNSWSNLPDAEPGGQVGSPRSGVLSRSRSSEDISKGLEGVQEAAPAQPQPNFQQQ